MKEVSTVKTFKFDSFAEMFDFVQKPNCEVRYDNSKKLIVKNGEFYIDEYPQCEDTDLTPLAQYFVNGVVHENGLAKKYNLALFIGEEAIQRTYTVRYYELTYIEREIMASSPLEAEQKMNEMVANGTINTQYPEVEHTECRVMD